MKPMKLPEIKLPIIRSETIDKVLEATNTAGLLLQEQPAFSEFLLTSFNGDPFSKETGAAYTMASALYLCILLELENDYTKFKELLDRLNKAKVEAKVKAMNS